MPLKKIVNIVIKKVLNLLQVIGLAGFIGLGFLKQSVYQTTFQLLKNQR